MCLGLNWNPKRLTYEFIRSVDNCVVPPIPLDLGDMAYDALAYAREFMEEYSAYTNDYILPTCYFNTLRSYLLLCCQWESSSGFY